MPHLSALDMSIAHITKSYTNVLFTSITLLKIMSRLFLDATHSTALWDSLSAYHSLLRIQTRQSYYTSWLRPWYCPMVNHFEHVPVSSNIESLLPYGESLSTYAINTARHIAYVWLRLSDLWGYQGSSGPQVELQSLWTIHMCMWKASRCSWAAWIVLP